MSSKIKIKIGLIEIEYEGSEEFLKEELPSLLEAVTELYKETGAVAITPPAAAESAPATSAVASPESIDIGTTNSIAAKLGVKTGTELAIAASARLVIGMQKEQFTRKELLQEMQNGTQYYKATHGSNLSKTIKTLVGDHKFIERAKDTYALKADVVKSLETQLA